MVLDGQGLCLEVNQKGYEQMGVVSNDILGSNFADLWPVEEREVIENALNMAFKGKNLSIFTNNNVEQGKEEIKWEIHFLALPSDKTSSEGLLIIAYDITGRKILEEKISKSLKEKEVLLQEVHHRVGNNMAVISSLLSLQASHLEENTCEDVFLVSQSRIKSMALVHENLYQSEDFININVSSYVNSLIDNIKKTFIGVGKNIKFIVNIDELNINLDLLVPCGLLINEVLTNSCKYAFSGHNDPVITLTMSRLDNENLSLNINDNGIGLPNSAELSQSNGLGLKLIKTLTAQLEGTMEINSENGTAYSFIFTAES